MVVDNEFQRLIPPLSADEFNQLEQNILQEGIRDALVTWNGILIDGHNRYSIAKRHNLPYKTVEMQFDSRADVIRWIILNQFGRRNLSAYDRSILALKLKPVIAEKAKENLAIGAEMTNTGLQKSVKAVNTQKELAKVAGVSHDTIAKVEKIEAKATPKVKADVQSGKISINQAYQTIRRTEAKEEKAQRKQYVLADEMPQDACNVFTADVTDGLPQIADESVDFVITDPPYSKEFIPLYYDLAIVAGRTLKDGGSLLVMCGQSYLPEVIRAMCSSLTYHWCLTYLTPGGQSPRLFQKRVNTFWKPVLWFVKGTYTGDYVGDVLKSSVNDNDKRFHEWGQSVSGMTDIIQRFTNPGDIILDPFLGGGTTGVAAVSMGRKFIGTDIKSANVEKARERIKEAYKLAGSKAGTNQLA